MLSGYVLGTSTRIMFLISSLIDRPNIRLYRSDPCFSFSCCTPQTDVHTWNNVNVNVANVASWKHLLTNLSPERERYSTAHGFLEATVPLQLRIVGHYTGPSHRAFGEHGQVDGHELFVFVVVKIVGTLETVLVVFAAGCARQFYLSIFCFFCFSSLGSRKLLLPERGRRHRIGIVGGRRSWKTERESCSIRPSWIGFRPGTPSSPDIRRTIINIIIT